MAITKIEITAVVPVDLTHHRELPIGQYVVVLSGFRQPLHLLRRVSDGCLILINWKGRGEVFRDFAVRENDVLEFDDPNDRSDP